MFVYFYKRGSIIFNSSLFLNKTIYFLFLSLFYQLFLLNLIISNLNLKSSLPMWDSKNFPFFDSSFRPVPQNILFSFREETDPYDRTVSRNGRRMPLEGRREKEREKK